jgi:RNA polymerase sigma-70 factor (ECF subfamily)
VRLRLDLTTEAIRLTRALAELMTEEQEVSGLLALMLFTDSRRRARVDQQGELVTLEEQDRSCWDQDGIAEGRRVLGAAMAGRLAGPYQLQAAIAACHAAARQAVQTDWVIVADLYTRLAEIAPSPAIELNRAVALGMADGIEVGLARVDQLAASGALEGYYLLPATKADLLRRLSRHAEASASYRAAQDLAPTDVERRYLLRRLAEVDRSTPTERNVP